MMKRNNTTLIRAVKMYYLACNSPSPEKEASLHAVTRRLNKEEFAEYVKQTTDGAQ